MEQYRRENVKLEKDLPTLREVPGSTWKKEEELKRLKSDVAALDRNTQLALTLAQQQNEQANYTGKNTSDTIIETSDHLFITKLSGTGNK